MPEYNMPAGARDEQHNTGYLEDEDSGFHTQAEFEEHESQFGSDGPPIPHCTDCHEPAGKQHRPSCHRQGLVTEASVYICPACGGKGTYLGQLFDGVQPCPKCAGDGFDKTVASIHRPKPTLPTPSDFEIVYADILQERRAQDAQWGGGVHDDSHDLTDWPKFIARFTRLAADSVSLSVEKPEHIEFEKRMIKIAALAVAAIQSSRRQRNA